MPNIGSVPSVALAAAIVLVVAIVVTLCRSEAPPLVAAGEVHPAVIHSTSESALARVSTPASAVTAQIEKADKATTQIAIPRAPVEDGATMLSRVQSFTPGHRPLPCRRGSPPWSMRLIGKLTC